MYQKSAGKQFKAEGSYEVCEMKAFVGTLYSGENEYEECLAAIRDQTYKNYDHYIYENLPKREAHRILFSSFLARKDDYALLIKVDADTVITSPALFDKIVLKFSQNDWLEVMNIGVTDFFCGLMIPAGIQIYRNNVHWDLQKDTIFTDIPEIRSGSYLYDTTELAPAAIHCKNPSPLQAFHYGVHRGLKSIALIHSTTHWAFLEKVWQNFLKTNDVRIGLAVLGAELVYAGKLGKADADYTNPGMQMALERYHGLEAQGVRREILRLRLRNWGWLPGDLRRRLIRSIRGKHQ